MALPRSGGGPAQRQPRVARGGRLHQSFEIGQQSWIFLQRSLAAAAGAPDPLRFHRGSRLELLEATPNGGIRDPRGARDDGDAAPAGRPSLRRCPDPPSSLRQTRRHARLLRPAETDVHSSSVPTESSNSFTYSLTLPKMRRGEDEPAP